MILGLMLPIIISAGSANGLCKANLGMWMMGGLLVGLFGRIISINGCQNLQRYFATVSAILLALLGYHGVKYVYFDGIYRDSSNHQELVKNLCSPRLKGIYTSHGRAESVNGLIGAITRFTKRGDQILAYHYIPMIYFASDTLPLGNHCSLTYLALPDLAKKMDGFSEQNPPTLILRSKTNTTSLEWGLRTLPFWNDQADKQEMLQKVALIDLAVQKK